MTTVLDQAADYSWMPRILETVTSYFSHLLWTSPDAEPARALLAKRRISDESAKAFRLGFAPPGWETTHRHLRSEGIAVEQLELLGLAIARKKTSGHFDKFRSRLIFPITASHQVVALAGRTVLTNDPGPKYTRTLSTPLSRTTTALFGLDQAEVHVAATGRVLLVEGFIDAIVLHQHGLRATAALSGTALSDEEIALLARGGARSMALLFDGDAGGRAAARHLASRLRHAPLPSTIAFCPEGQDPDDAVRADGPRSLAALALAGRDPVDLILDGIPISDRDSIEARVSTLRALLIGIQRRSRPLTDPQLERIAQMFGIRLPTIRSAIADIGDRGDFTPTVSGLTLARSST